MQLLINLNAIKIGKKTDKIPVQKLILAFVNRFRIRNKKKMLVLHTLSCVVKVSTVSELKVSRRKPFTIL